MVDTHTWAIFSRPSPHSSGHWIWTAFVSTFDINLLKSLGWTLVARDPCTDLEDDPPPNEIQLVRQLDERWSFSRSRKRLTE